MRATPVTSSRLAPAVVLAISTGCSVAARADETSVQPAPTSPPVIASQLAAEPPSSAQQDPIPIAAANSGEAPGVPLRWTASGEISGRSYLWSLSRGKVDLGMRFDAPPSTAVRPYEQHADTPGPIVPALPSISLGVRRVAASQVASSLLERSNGAANSEAYVSKVGIEWKPAESRVNFLREGLGIRLEGNDRMTVRLRKGVLGVYMQRKF